MSGLELDIRRKAFGAEEVLRDVALRVRPGEAVAVLGPSGIGKSTLLRIAAGLDSAFDGRVLRPERIAVAFQEPTLLPWRTAAENVQLTTGADPGPALAAVGLAGKAALHPGRLSLGQRRRLALARALAAEPELLLLDEPFASLDPATAAEMVALTARLLAERRPATVLVTHRAEEALALADRAVRLAGRPATLAGAASCADPAAVRALAGETESGR